MSFELIRRRRAPVRAWIGRMPLLALLACWFVGGCADEEPTGPVAVDDQCVACHTSREQLTVSATPDTTTPPENPGEG